MDSGSYPYGFIVPDLPELEVGQDQNALEEMLTLGNTAEADVLRTHQAVKIESFAYPNQVFMLENVVTESSTTPIVSHSLDMNEAVGHSVGQGERQAVFVKILAEQPEGPSVAVENEWEPASNTFQEMTEPGENAEAEQQPSTSAMGISQPTSSKSSRVRKCSEELVSSTEQAKTSKSQGKTGCAKRRAKKNVVPDAQKDSEYWEKRHKNNRAARRSRRAKRLSESRSRLIELIDENERLMEQVLANRIAIEEFKRNILTLGLEPKMI